MSTLQNKAIACQTFESVSRTLLGLGPAGAETPEAASLTLQRVVIEDVVAEADSESGASTGT